MSGFVRLFKQHSVSLSNILQIQKKPLVGAHRGGSLIARENTIEAYKKSVDLKVDIVETDVRSTKDGIIVCFHDDGLDRLADIDKKIKDLRFEDLRTIYPQVPTIKELIKFCKDKVFLIIEVKENGFENQLVRAIEESNALDKVIIISFKEDVVKKIKEINSSINVGNLMRVSLLSNNGDKLVKKTLKLKARVLCLNYQAFSRKLLEKCHKNNIALWLWTVNDEKNMKRFIDYGVDAIISDSPDKLIGVRF